MVLVDDIKNMAIIGGGIMGSGIAQVALLSGYEKVVLVDLSDEILRKSKEIVQRRIEALESEEQFKKFLSESDISTYMREKLNFKEKLNVFESVGIISKGIDTQTIMSRLITETSLPSAIKDADFVIEAVPEILEVKQNVFKELSENSPSHTILASNTSTMSITKIAEFSRRPENVIGMHFHTFFPIFGMLIEITPGIKSSNNSLRMGYAIAQKFPCLIGERFTVQLEKESPGLIANRFDIAGSLYHNWLINRAFENGISREQLDAADMSSELADAIGIDTIYYSSKYFEEHVSPDFTPSKRITDLYKVGKLGKKVGQGYYKWNENKPIRKLPPVEKKTTEFLRDFLDPEIYSAIRLNEACRLLEEGVVKSYELIDKVQLKATFMPGPFDIGKTKYKEWAEKLHKFAEISGKSYLKPCDMMESGRFLNYR
ncbi:MAG: 3-hydroxyacyl-CoA dehydrogenase family protein [Candidatus Hodarchaeota archaeon]